MLIARENVNTKISSLVIGMEVSEQRMIDEKMIELDAHGLATGHLAKVFRQENHDSVYIHSSNDEHFDQSGILSRLPHDILSKLMLPLSDLQQKEINKLAENFGINAQAKLIKMHECFSSKNVSQDYFSQNIPARYKKPGEIVDSEKNSLGDHNGVSTFEYGEVVFPAGQRPNDQFLMSKFSFQDKKIEGAKIEHFRRNKIFLTQCKISEETSWVEPLQGVVKISEEVFAECWIYPKNISSALIEMVDAHQIFEGEMLTIFKKKGKNSKVYLTGKARYVQEEHLLIQEEGKERAKVDHSRDF
jgi:tRNA-specific 2-thiouridylase